MKALRIRNTFFWTVALTILLFISIATDLLPWLRGPAPFPESWQWPYDPHFSFVKVIVPVCVLLGMTGILYFFEEKKKKVTLGWLLILTLLSFFFTLAVLFFSRGGLGILLQRIIDLGFSGYFTAATKIHNLPDFLSQYHENMEQYYTHPRAHPPGWILFHWIINSVSMLFTPFTSSVLESIKPTHHSVQQIWKVLSPSQQIGALLSTLIIPLFAATIIIPTYLTSKFFTNSKTSLRIAMLSGLAPSIILFTPLPDVLFPVLCMTAFYFLLQGINQEAQEFTFLGGIIISLALFAGLNVLPFFLFMGLYLFFTRTLTLTVLRPYILGVLLIPLFFYTFFAYEYIQVVIQAAIEGKAPRDYLTWIPFNMVDFFMYTGIPVTVLFFAKIFIFFLEKIKLEKPEEKIFSALCITIVLLLVSGFTRGEVGRLWVSLMPLVALASATEINKLSSRQFLAILVLVGLQVIFMQGYWVSLW